MFFVDCVGDLNGASCSSTMFHMFEEHARNQTLGQRRSATRSSSLPCRIRRSPQRIGPPRENPPLAPFWKSVTPAAVLVGWPLVIGCKSTLSPLFEKGCDPGRFTMKTH
jgi:hypothetical protein